MTHRATSPDPAPLALPPGAPEPVRPGFPWIASIAPVVGASVVWAITGSAFALVFAALGPVVAIATMFDARRHGARARRKALDGRGEALERLREEIARRHELERDAAWRATPSARSVAGRPVPAWQHPVPRFVTIGRGAITSELRISGAAVAEPDRDLLREAATLEAAPVRVEVADGVGFAGPAHLARAAARAVVVQCGDASSPERLAIDGPPGEAWGWLGAVPHRRPGAPAVILVQEALPCGASERPRTTAPSRAAPPPATAAVIAVAGDVAALPPGLGAVIALSSPRAAVLHRTGHPPVEVVPELLGSAEALEWARGSALAARRAGLGSRDRDLPDRVSLAELQPARPADPLGRDTLRVAVGAGPDGPFELDLAEGPHALVAGTTGSGKSEFLLAWLTALARSYGPDRAAFLLVDFKGGAAFEPIAELPHVTGIVTDLDEREAGRAVSSVRAELRRREHVLRAAGARDIAVLEPGIELPRLVVVVDEFQAMVERFPDVGAVIADVAARGRSLGVHLVLASQRPNGVVREQVTANCGIRVSLRVLQRADSVAVVGSEAAALIEPGRPGRAVADVGDGRPVPFQSALADSGTIERVGELHAGAARPRRPWLDPLPLEVTPGTLDAALAHGRPSRMPARPIVGGRRGIVVLGVADDPERQRRVAVEWRPRDDGPLAVLGAPGSGRSALLDAIAEQVERGPGSPAVARLEGSRGRVWDELHRLAGAVASGGPLPEAILVDDLDTVFAGWADDYRFTALARTEELLRAARGAGVAVAAAATRLTGLGPGLRDAFTATALLRHPTRADLVHAGGAGGLWVADAPPGSGQWRGLMAQFLRGARRAPVGIDEPEALALPHLPLVAVTAVAPAADARSIAARMPQAQVIVLDDGADALARATAALEAPTTGSPQRIVIGSAQAWAANWSLASAARARATVVVHGGPLEFRALARGGGLPPLLDDPVRQCWIVPVGGEPGRAGWPGTQTTDSARPRG